MGTSRVVVVGAVVGALFGGGCSASSADETVAHLITSCFPVELVALSAETVRYRRRLAARGDDDGVFTAAAFGCLDAAASPPRCAAARGCLTGITFERVNACAAVTRCDGTMAVQCLPRPTRPFRVVSDCAAWGQVCVDGGAMPTCADATCDPDTVSFTCSVREIEECSAGRLDRTTCPEGTTCREGSISCYGEACTADACDGTVALPCDVGMGLRLPSYDCADLGQTCRDGYCVPNGSECSFFSPLPHCEGNVLVGCTDGFVTRYDCVGHGFLSCDEWRCRAVDE